jgi:hypothetical protein
METIEMDKRILDDVFYALRTCFVIISKKNLTEEEENKMKFLTKMFEQHSQQIKRIP